MVSSLEAFAGGVIVVFVSKQLHADMVSRKQFQALKRNKANTFIAVELARSEERLGRRR